MRTHRDQAGKATLIASVGVGKPVVRGFRGNPVSALWWAQGVSCTVFIPVIISGGKALKRRSPAAARVARGAHRIGALGPGREEYRAGENRSEAGDRPARGPSSGGKSGMLSTLVKADGFVVVPIHAEGIPPGNGGCDPVLGPG